MPTLHLNPKLKEAAVAYATHTLSLSLNFQAPSENNLNNFVGQFSNYEITIMPVANWVVWYTLNSEATRAGNYYDVSEGINFADVPGLAEKAKTNLLNRIPEMMEAMSDDVIMTYIQENSLGALSFESSYPLAIAHTRKVCAEDFDEVRKALPKILKAIVSNDVIKVRLRFEIGSLLASIERVIESNQNELYLRRPQRALLAYPDSQIVEPIQQNLIGGSKTSFYQRPEVQMIAIGVPVAITALCAFTLIYTRAASLGRMGASIGNAINSGITFLKGSKRVAIAPLEKDLEKNITRSI